MSPAVVFLLTLAIIFSCLVLLVSSVVQFTCWSNGMPEEGPLYWILVALVYKNTKVGEKDKVILDSFLNLACTATWKRDRNHKFRLSNSAGQEVLIDLGTNEVYVDGMTVASFIEGGYYSSRFDKAFRGNDKALEETARLNTVAKFLEKLD